MKYRFFIVLAYFLTYGLNLLSTAQTGQIVPVSPEASALAKMVNYPVNNNTGIPNISIPFYEIKVGNLTLPINFTYQGGGFKINEHATPEGLGWRLSANLQITRTINGLDDFKDNVGYIGNILMKAYDPSASGSYYPLWTTYRNPYDLAAGLKDGQPDKFNYSLLGKSGSFYFMKNTAGTGYTIVPVPYDNIKITFNNGQFIIVDTDGTTYYFGEQGSVELSTLAANGKEVTGTFSSLESACFDCKVTGWKCMRIESSTATNTIDFSYQAQNIARYRSYSDRIEYYDNENPCTLGLDGAYYHSDATPLSSFTSYENILQNIPFYRISSPKYMVYYGNGQPVFHVPSFDSPYDMTDKTYKVNNYTSGSEIDIAGLALSHIQFRGGKVVFNGADHLVSIDVSDDENHIIKSVHLYQSYTNAVYAQESKLYNGLNFQGTPYLDSLHIENGGNTYDRYAFLYNDKFCYGNHLKGHDAWGYPNASTVEIAYANNTSGNILSLPSKHLTVGKYFLDLAAGCTNYLLDVFITIGGDDWAEAPDEEYAKKGALKRIIYPTGGFEDFDWESNKYLGTFNDGYGGTQKIPRLAGGLRIRSISYFDGKGLLPEMQKYYRYGDLEDGTGTLLHSPHLPPETVGYHYDAVDYNQQVAYLSAPDFPACYDRSCLSVKTIENKATYTPASALNYTYESGSPIYYTKVTIYRKDLGAQSGKTVYEYYPPDQFMGYPVILHEESRIPETPLNYLETDGLMGAEKAESEYTCNPVDGYQLIHRKSFEYTRFLKDLEIQVAYSFFHVLYQVVEGNYQSINPFDLYNDTHNFASSLLTLENDYIDGIYGIVVGRLLISQVTDQTFNGSNVLTQTTEYHYNNPDYLQPSSIDYSTSKGLNITKTIKYPYNFSGIYTQMTSSNMIDVPIEVTETNISLGKEISKKKTNYDHIDEGWGFFAPVSIQSSYGGAPLLTDATIDKYDQYGNILQRTLKDGINISYLWGYDNLYPVAQLKGIKYSEIPSSYLSNIQINNPSSDANLRSLLSGLRNSFSGDEEITTFTYQRLIGITSETSPNNYTTYYDYDPIGRLINQKDNDQHLIKHYSYNMTGPTSSSLTPWYVNYPMMETHFQYCGSNNYVPYNYIVPGGSYTGYNQHYADIAAEYDLDNVYNSPPPYACPDYPIAVPVQIESLDEETNPDLKLDFLQNGEIVASAKVPWTSDVGNAQLFTLYLKPGEYQLSFRVNAGAHYLNPLHYNFTEYDADNHYDYGAGVGQGDSVTILENKHYSILLYEE